MTKLVFIPNLTSAQQSSIPDTVSRIARIGASQSATTVGDAVSERAGPLALSVSRELDAMGRRRKPLEVVDVSANGTAALVDVPQRRTLPESSQGTFHPLVDYVPAIAMADAGSTARMLQTSVLNQSFFKLRVEDKVTGDAMAGIVVVLRPRGAQAALSAVSAGDGSVTFGIRATSLVGASVFIEPGFDGHWGLLMHDATLNTGDVLKVERIDLDYRRDCLRHLLHEGQGNHGEGVKVAIIDTGVGPHFDLAHATGDDDTSLGHGSHVAGIVCGRGAGARAGLAPGADLLSYRVFNDAATGVAKNFEIHQAIIQAVIDGCDIINLSLKMEHPSDPMWNDEVVSTALAFASDAGVLCVAAAGNDFHNFVTFPARHQDVVSVSALGWEPSLPDDAYDRWTVGQPRSTTDKDVYFASFSNVGINGTEVDLIAPGAGVVSTVPGEQYAPMSGTSMACPAAVGMTARLLSDHPNVLNAPRDRQRTEAIRQLAFTHAETAGFDARYEGRGMPMDDLAKNA
ncbi:MAG: S8 family serine peptidase [Pseudomonadota bacterium]